MHFEIFASGLDHPEGLAFAPDGTLFAGGEAGQIYAIDPQGNHRVHAECGGFTLGLAFSPHGELFACNSAKGVLRISASGKAEVFASSLVCPNFPAFDASGRLWISDSGRWKQNNGAIYCFDSDGRKAASHTGLGYANGLCFGHDGTLYWAESDTRRILTIEGAVVAEEVGRTPDGIALAPDGSLYVACYATDDIWRVSSHSKVRVAHDPDAILLCRPTNLIFHDRYLYVANLGRTTIVRARV